MFVDKWKIYLTWRIYIFANLQNITTMCFNLCAFLSFDLKCLTWHVRRKSFIWILSSVACISLIYMVSSPQQKIYELKIKLWIKGKERTIQKTNKQTNVNWWKDNSLSYSESRGIFWVVYFLLLLVEPVSKSSRFLSQRVFKTIAKGWREKNACSTERILRWHSWLSSSNGKVVQTC